MMHIYQWYRTKSDFFTSIVLVMTNKFVTIMQKNHWYRIKNVINNIES